MDAGHVLDGQAGVLADELPDELVVRRPELDAVEEGDVDVALGVRNGGEGEAGDLLLAPQLTAEQFDETGTAELRLTFAGRPLTVRYHNAARKEAGSYRLGEVRCGDTAVTPGADGTVKLPRALVEQLPAEGGLITAELV